MNKKLIRLTESDLHRIVKESVGKIINEIGDTYDGYKMLGKLQHKKSYIDNDDNAAEYIRNYRNNILKNNPDFVKKDQDLQNYFKKESEMNRKRILKSSQVQSVSKKLSQLTGLMLNHCYLHPKGGSMLESDVQEALELSKRLCEYSLNDIIARSIQSYFYHMHKNGIVNSEFLVKINELLDRIIKQ